MPTRPRSSVSLNRPSSFEVGLTTITDVHEAEAERDQALADEINAENTLDKYMRACAS